MIRLRSKLAQQVLSHIFLQEQEFYASELARRLQLDRGNLIRKLHEWEQEGLLTSETRGRERYYRLNASFPLLKEYQTIVHRTVGVEHRLRELVGTLDGIERAFLFGSYVRDQMDASSDIDVFVVGRHDTLALQRAVARLQKEIDRDINVISMDPDEFTRRQREDAFMQEVLKKPRKSLR